MEMDPDTKSWVVNNEMPAVQLERFQQRARELWRTNKTKIKSNTPLNNFPCEITNISVS